METMELGQVSAAAAEVYEAFFVPALFAQFAGPVADAAAVGAGQAALDVACGTGVLARELRRRSGAEGRVVGLDRNAGMLAVARRSAPGIDWREGMAERLPFADDSFDAAVSQFGLMFFEDRRAALAEMWRVVRPGGRVAVAVWDAAEHSPGYARMIELVERLFDAKVAAALKAPFVLGDEGVLAAELAAAGIPGARIETVAGVARFPSIDDWMLTDVKGWTLADLIDDAGFARLQEAARRELGAFTTAEGSVSFAMPAHLAVARKPAA